MVDSRGGGAHQSRFRRQPPSPEDLEQSFGSRMMIMALLIEVAGGDDSQDSPIFTQERRRRLPVVARNNFLFAKEGRGRCVRGSGFDEDRSLCFQGNSWEAKCALALTGIQKVPKKSGLIVPAWAPSGLLPRLLQYRPRIRGEPAG